MLLEQRAIRRTRILHSAIRMMHHARWGAPQAERLGERPNRQRVIEPRVGTPPDDAPRGEVEHDREIEPAFRRPQIRDVRGPHPIALALHRHTELPVELVRRQRQGMARLGRHAETPWTDAPQPIKAHEPRDALLRTPDPLRAQLGVDLRGAVALMTRRMGRADREAQPLILRSAVAGAPLVRRVEARGRHPERPTHESRLELAHMLSDAGVPHRDSFAKNAAAFFRKSRSWRSRSFSRRKRASSCSAVSGRGSRSVVSSSLYPRRLPGPGKISFGFAPLGAAAICLAQTRSRSGPSSSSSATRCRLTPVANRSFINRTTSTLNSGVCCRARFPLVVLMNTSSKHYLRCPPNRVNSTLSSAATPPVIVEASCRPETMGRSDVDSWKAVGSRMPRIGSESNLAHPSISFSIKHLQGALDRPLRQEVGFAFGFAAFASYKPWALRAERSRACQWSQRPFSLRTVAIPKFPEEPKFGMLTLMLASSPNARMPNLA